MHFSIARERPCENLAKGDIGARICPDSNFELIRYISINSETHKKTETNTSCTVSSAKIIKELSEKDFNDQHILTNVPCILNNMTKDWPAMRHNKWSFEMLLRTYKDTYFLYNNWFRTSTSARSVGADQERSGEVKSSSGECNRLAFENPESELNVIKLSTFLDEIDSLTLSNNGNTLSNISDITRYSANLPYIFDSSFSAGQSSALLGDYTPPRIFSGDNDILGLLSEHLSINFRWFLLGPKNSGEYKFHGVL